MSHVMVDIETLGLKPGCIVTAFAAVHFDAYEILDQVSFALDVKVVQRDGFYCDATTALWWAEQSPKAQRLSLRGDQHPAAAALEFQTWCHKVAPEHYWARGQDFDFPILEAFLEFYLGGAEQLPWAYDQKRDTRTMLDLLPPDAFPEFVGEKHVPLVDATHEARCLQFAWQAREAS